MVFNGWIYIGLAACAPLVGLAGMRTNRRRPLLMAGIALALVCVLVILFAPVPRNSSLVALLHLLLGVGISAGTDAHTQQQVQQRH